MMNFERTIDKVLVFDVWGDYAHFRRFYTTTSPLTFPIPPRTALCGLIGAIIGLDKEDNDYLKYFSIDDAFIGLRLLTPVKKTMIAQNLIHTKDAKGIGMNLITKRTQINFEFIKDPKYRIYFYHSDEAIYQKTKDMLATHKSVYTPCLGLSENIANFAFVGEHEISIHEASQSEYQTIHSVIPANKIVKEKGLKFDSDMKYFSIRLPIELNTERVVLKYDDIIFEGNCQPISAKLNDTCFSVLSDNGEQQNIVFIE